MAKLSKILYDDLIYPNFFIWFWNVKLWILHFFTFFINRVIGRSLNKKISLTLRILSLWGLRWENWYISGTHWRIWVLKPILEALLNSIRTFSTKILVPVSNSLSKLVSKLTNGEKWLTLVQNAAMDNHLKFIQGLLRSIHKDFRFVFLLKS